MTIFYFYNFFDKKWFIMYSREGVNMKIGIASDHRGYKVKEKLKKYFDKKNIEYVDYGTDSIEVVDYPLFAKELCKGVLSKDVEMGILICGTGIGMSIVANKFKGIMCAKVDNSDEARLAKEHNHANIISFSAKKTMWEIKDIVDAYLRSEYLKDERYLRRIEEIEKMEKLRKY